MRRRLHPLVPKEPSPPNLETTEKSRISAASLEKTIREIDLQGKALQLSAEGYSHRQISVQLNVAFGSVAKLIADGLEEYRDKRDKRAEEYFAIHMRRHDLMIQKWLPRAIGYTEQITNADGAIVECTHPPDANAGRIVATLQRDAARMFGFNKVRVEHTGANGGPIMNMNANFDWSRATDEQLAQAAAGDEVVIRQLNSAGPSSSAARDPSSSSGEDGGPDSHH